MMKLKDLREKKAFLSQAELAAKADMARRTINRLERGLERPHGRTVRKLAAALGVEPGQIEFSEYADSSPAKEQRAEKETPPWARPAPSSSAREVEDQSERGEA